MCDFTHYFNRIKLLLLSRSRSLTLTHDTSMKFYKSNSSLDETSRASKRVSRIVCTKDSWTPQKCGVERTTFATRARSHQQVAYEKSSIRAYKGPACRYFHDGRMHASSDDYRAAFRQLCVRDAFAP